MAERSTTSAGTATVEWKIYSISFVRVKGYHQAFTYEYASMK